MKRFLLKFSLLFCLGVAVALWVAYAYFAQSREFIYLRLAPQGVHIENGRARLQYDLNLRPLNPDWPRQGYLLPDLDMRQVVTAWTPDSGLKPEKRIGYEVRGGQIWLGDFVIPVPQEKFDTYRGARYAQFTWGRDGKLSFLGLTDASLHRL